MHNLAVIAIVVALGIGDFVSADEHDLERVPVGRDGKIIQRDSKSARPETPRDNYEWVQDLFCIKESESYLLSIDQLANYYFTSKRNGDHPILQLRLKLIQTPVGKKPSEDVVWQSKPFIAPRGRVSKDIDSGLLNPHVLERFLTTGSQNHVRLVWELVEVEIKSKSVPVPADTKIPSSKPTKKVIQYAEQVGKPLHVEDFKPCEPSIDGKNINAVGGGIELWFRHKKVDFSDAERAKQNLVFEELTKQPPRKSFTGKEDEDTLIVKAHFTNKQATTLLSGIRDYQMFVSLKDKKGNITPLMEPYWIKVDKDKTKGMQFEIPVGRVHRVAYEHAKKHGVRPDKYLIHVKTSGGYDLEAQVQIETTPVEETFTDQEDKRKYERILLAMVAIEATLPQLKRRDLEHLVHAAKAAMTYDKNQLGVYFKVLLTIQNFEVKFYTGTRIDEQITLSDFESNRLQNAFSDIRESYRRDITARSWHSTLSGDIEYKPAPKVELKREDGRDANGLIILDEK